jgi:hypothetical protein
LPSLSPEAVVFAGHRVPFRKRQNAESEPSLTFPGMFGTSPFGATKNIPVEEREKLGIKAKDREVIGAYGDFALRESPMPYKTT